MKKYSLAIFLCFMSTSSMACQNALPTNHPNFCESFKAAATCYCIANGLPSVMCQDLNALYGRMMAVFGTLQKACEYQKNTPTQTCIDNWTCHLKGGVDSQNQLCRSTGHSC